LSWSTRKKTGEFLSGKTGDNYIQLISIFHESPPDIFTSVCKKGYHIDNSSENVYYEGYLNSDDKRTTSYIWDIKSPENIDRIKDSLFKIKIVFSFGKDAECVLNEAGISFIKALCHLGTKGLKSLKLTDKTVDEKLHVIAEDLLVK